MSKHTKGPWHVGGKDGTIVYAGDGYATASCAVFHGRFSNGEVEANARLIAAAPNMLEALHMAREFINLDRVRLLDCCTRSEGEIDSDDAAVVADYDAALKQIDEAIAKTIGGNP